MADKVTTMVLKVNLQCSRCYKKVKKVLCKFPQIRDQIYDKKANTVTITVVCCSPEKIRDKICCKGRGSIKSIEIKPPPKPKQPEKKLDKPKSGSGPEDPKGSKSENKSEKPTPPKPTSPPSMACPPIGFCCMECYHGRGGGPCHFGGAPPPPCYVTCGRPVYDCWGGGGSYTYSYESRSYCFREAYSQPCSIM